jgi:hypothetical protein
MQMDPTQQRYTTSNSEDQKPIGYPPDIRDHDDYPKEKIDIDNNNKPTEPTHEIDDGTPATSDDIPPAQELPGKDDLGGVKRQV